MSPPLTVQEGATLILAGRSQERMQAWLGLGLGLEEGLLLTTYYLPPPRAPRAALARRRDPCTVKGGEIWAALEAASSSTRGSGWAPSGPASSWECRAGREARPEEAQQPSWGTATGAL